jgi:hypothetical protein
MRVNRLFLLGFVSVIWSLSLRLVLLFTPEAALVLISEEAIVTEQQRAEAERQRAKAERQRVESAEARLERYRQQFGDLSDG